MSVNQQMLEALIAKRQDLSTTHPYFKGMIYGESGFGKTVAAMKLAQAITPPGKTIEFIDFLEGWVSLLNHPELMKRANRQAYEGLSQLEFLADCIIEGVEPFDKVGTVVVDEISAMGKADLDIVLKTRAKKDPSKDPNVPTQPDFYANTERMRRTVNKILTANINVIFVAHIREDKLNSGLVVTRPALMPAFSETFRQMMHLVGNLTAEEFVAEDGTQEYKRAIQVHPTKRVSAKTRIGGLPVNMEIDDLIAAIVEWMQGNRKSEVMDTKTDENLVVVDDTSEVDEEVKSDDLEAIEIN